MAARTPLVPCPSCTRHVFAHEGTCPFCATTLPHDLASRAAPATTARLSRAQLFAFNERPLRQISDEALAFASGGASFDRNSLTQGTSMEDDPGGQFQMYGAPNIDPGTGFDPGGGLNPEDDPGAQFQMYGAPNVEPSDWQQNGSSSPGDDPFGGTNNDPYMGGEANPGNESFDNADGGFNDGGGGGEE